MKRRIRKKLEKIKRLKQKQAKQECQSDNSRRRHRLRLTSEMVAKVIVAVKVTVTMTSILTGLKEEKSAMTATAAGENVKSRAAGHAYGATRSDTRSGCE